MAKKKEWTRTMRGGQLISAGDVIRIMDGSGLQRCRVLSCIATEDGGCLANVEALEGANRGERFTAKLSARSEQS